MRRVALFICAFLLGVAGLAAARQAAAQGQNVGVTVQQATSSPSASPGASTSPGPSGSPGVSASPGATASPLASGAALGTNGTGALGTSGGTSGGTLGNPLPKTGAEIALMVILALVLIGAGTFLVVTARVARRVSARSDV